MLCCVLFIKDRRICGTQGQKGWKDMGMSSDQPGTTAPFHGDSSHLEWDQSASIILGSQNKATTSTQHQSLSLSLPASIWRQSSPTTMFSKQKTEDLLKSTVWAIAAGDTRPRGRQLIMMPPGTLVTKLMLGAKSHPSSSSSWQLSVEVFSAANPIELLPALEPSPSCTSTPHLSVQLLSLPADASCLASSAADPCPADLQWHFSCRAEFFYLQ